ncbi:MAG: hypothetical protein WDN31_11790 [Hyphomicrobium sp.]
MTPKQSPPPQRRRPAPRLLRPPLRARRLHRGQDRLFRETLPGLEIALPEATRSIPAALFPRATRFALEIGYGAASTSRGRPCSTPTPAISARGLLRRHRQAGAGDRCGKDRQRRLFTDDALKLLSAARRSLDEAWLLYPPTLAQDPPPQAPFVSPRPFRARARPQARRAVPLRDRHRGTMRIGRWRTS